MNQAEESHLQTALSGPHTWRKRLVRGVLGAIALAGLLTLVVSVWLPDFLRPRVEAAAQAALGTPVRLGALRIQPWTLSVAVQDLAVGEAAAPVFTLKQADVQLSLESLWRLAPVVRRIGVQSPRVFLERLQGNRLNITPIIERLTSGPSTPPSKDPARFALYNIALNDGEVHFDDRVLKQSHHIDQIKLSLPFLSNLPSFIKVEADPALSARIDGSPLLIEGRSLPFDQGHKSELSLNWRRISVPHWMEAASPMLPAAWGLRVPSGEVDAQLTLHFEARPAPAQASVEVSGQVQVTGLGVTAAALPGVGKLDAGWTQLLVSGVEARPLERQIKVALVSLQGLRVNAQTLSAPQAKPASSKVVASTDHTAAKPLEPWQWHLGQVRVQADAIDVQTSSAAAWPGLRQLHINADGVGMQATAKGQPVPKPGQWSVALQDTQGGQFKASGQVDLNASQASSQWALSQWRLAPWTAPLASLPAVSDLPLRLTQGELAVSGEVKAQWPTPEQTQVSLSQGQVGVKDLGLQANQKGASDQVKWAALDLSGIQAEADAQGLRSVALEAIVLKGLDARVVRDAQGRVLGQGGASAAAASSQPAVAPTAPARSPLFAVASVRCQACQVRVLDQSVSPAAELALSQTELTVQGLSQDLGRKLNIDLSTRAQGQGSLRIKGQLKPQPLWVDATVGLKDLDLRVLQSYIDPLVNVSLAGALAQVDGRVSLQDDAKRGLHALYQGRLGLNALRVLDRVNDADFLSWKALDLQGMKVDWQAGALDANLGRISLQDFYGRVIVNPNGQLNLANIVRHQAGAEAKSITTPDASPADKTATAAVPASGASTASAAPGTSTTPAPKLRWEQIRLSGGRVDFTDNFIKPNYSARLSRVEGDISAVSSTQAEPATVKVSGWVDEGAPLLISGQVNPLGPRLFTDIEASAKGIELTRLTPYASRYAGYSIEKGTLSVKLHYKLDGGKLQAENLVFLDQLTFGEKTDSPDATSLPVRLAVSLLKNRAGEIDVNLPISGSLDEPQFSVGGIIWRVLSNLIVKAVTSPFSLLSGGGSDELGQVVFDPGSAALGDEARASLDKLATSLLDRPSLKLEATGMADPVRDVEGLRRVHVERLMRAAKAKSLGVNVAEVRVDPAERLQWLTAAYKAADIKKPRNLVGLSKSLPADEMEALLRASAPVDDAALHDLANRRGDRVKAYLAAHMPVERILLTASKVGAQVADAAASLTRVQFAVK